MSRKLPVLSVTAPPTAPAPATERREAGACGHLWQALREVVDPELPVSIVDLGLVYEIRAADGKVEVDLTFTATACPCMNLIQDDIRERLLAEPGVGEVEIRTVWDPPWTRERISEEGRAVLRRFGVAA